MLNIADFDEAYATKPKNANRIPLEAPECFVGSYPPVAKPGEDGPFFVNTYLLQPNANWKLERYLCEVRILNVRSKLKIKIEQKVYEGH